MTSSAYDRTVQAWARQWRDDNLDAKTLKLMAQTIQDLHEGPLHIGSGSYYPGFSIACTTIGKALQDLPSVIYIDAETETWQDKKPEEDRCDECSGIGEIEYKDLRGDLVIETCQSCQGKGSFDPAGDWWKASRQTLKKALLGQELASYV